MSTLRKMIAYLLPVLVSAFPLGCVHVHSHTDDPSKEVHVRAPFAHVDVDSEKDNGREHWVDVRVWHP